MEPAGVLMSELGVPAAMQPGDPGEAAAQVVPLGVVGAVDLGQAALSEFFSISTQRRAVYPICCPIKFSWVEAETAARAETAAPEGKAV